jgi:arylsulfatase A-like enzyme
MIVKWPGVTKSGSVCRENVIGVDFYPTLLEVTKTPAPEDYLLDGVSFVPLLKNAAAKLKRKAIHWHFPAYLQGYTARHGHFRTTPAAATRMGDWKLIEFFEDGTLELYNTEKDISETKNLAEKMPEKTKELHEAMLAWRKRTNAPVPTEPNPEYDPKAAKQGKGKKKGKK